MTIIGREREETVQARAPPTSPAAARAGEKLDPSYSHSRLIPCELRRCRSRATYVAVTAVVMWRAAQVYHVLAMLGWNHILQRPSDTELRKDLLILSTVEHFMSFKMFLCTYMNTIHLETCMYAFIYVSMNITIYMNGIIF